MVYQTLKPQHPKLSLGTVYRNLNQMADAGLIVRMPFRVDRYDGDISNHAHFCCEGCGRVFDLPMPEDHGDASALCAQHGFSLVRETRIFYGLCQPCQGAQPRQ
jgi:Fur family peroxide stress response transcriptional regulator